MKTLFQTILIPVIAALIASSAVVLAAQTNFLGVVFIADKTTTSHQLKVNSDGSINVTAE